MAQVAIADGTRLVVCTCGDCGVNYGMEEKYYEKRLEDAKTFYCPNGHGRIFTHRQTMQQRIASLADDLVRKDRRLDFERNQRRSVERTNSGLRGTITRKKRELARVSKGVCPKCNRSFQNLRRHMKCKHGA